MANASASKAPLKIVSSARCEELVKSVTERTFAQFQAQQLTAEQLGITFLDLRNPERPERGSYRGGERIYPASVVKSFYLVATHQWLETGKLKDSDELRRALRDMIVDSYNEATAYIVDLLTDTTSGPELVPDEFSVWHEKRNAVNRYFASLGYQNINLNRKTWHEGPYGRDKQLANQPPPDNRNWLTTDATARLFAEMVTGRLVSPSRCREMLALHERDPLYPNANTQSREYIGGGLPAGSKLWSKAGWTSEVRHDAAYVELPTGEKFVLVAFTVGHSQNKEIIPFVAKTVVEELCRAT